MQGQHEKINESHNNYNSIDLCKFIFSIFVIVGHTTPWTSIPLETVNTIIIYITWNITLQFFFIASGFLLFLKVELPFSQYPQGKSRLKNYINKSVRLYLIWTIIYLPLTIYGSIQSGRSAVMELMLFIRGVLFVGENYYSWPLWYLLALIVAVIIITYLLHCGFSVERIVVISVILYFAGLGIDYLDELTDLPYFIDLILKLYFLIFATTRNGIFVGMFYVSIGMLIAKRGGIKSLKIITLGLITGLISKTINILEILTISRLLTPFVLFNLILKLKFNNSSKYIYLRKASTIIFFVHMICKSIFVLLIMGNNEYNDLVIFVFTTLSSIALAALIIHIAENTRYKWLSSIYS